MSASGTDLEFPVRLVDLEATFALRKAVLRPWLTPEEARATWADTPEHFQVGALQNGPHGRRVASTAGFLVEAHPDYGALFGPVQWRLRGMASEPALQRRGVGGRVLDFGIEIGRTSCRARVCQVWMNSGVARSLKKKNKQ